MKITFDPVKRLRTLEDRKVDFEDAVEVFAGLTLTVKDDRQDYAEDRFQTIGFLSGRMVMIVWTPRGKARHVISMRKCNGREQARYANRFEGA